MLISDIQFPSLFTIVFIIIYHPPSSSIRSFLNDLSTILEYMSSYNTIILGYFNIQVNTDNHASLSLKKLICEHSLTQHIHFQTISNGNIIYLVLSPSDSNLISSPTQSTLISDHFAILFVLQLSVVQNTRPLRYFRNISSINQPLFVNSVFDHMNNIHLRSLTMTLSLTPSTRRYLIPLTFMLPQLLLPTVIIPNPPGSTLNSPI